MKTQLTQKEIEVLLDKINKEQGIENIANEMNKFFGSSIPRNHPVILHMNMCEISKYNFRFYLSILKQEGLINAEFEHNITIPSDTLDKLNTVGKKFYNATTVYQELQRTEAESQRTEAELKRTEAELQKTMEEPFKEQEEILKNAFNNDESAIGEFLRSLVDEDKKGLKSIEEIKSKSYPMSVKDLEGIFKTLEHMINVDVELLKNVDAKLTEVKERIKDLKIQLKQTEKEFQKTRSEFLTEFRLASQESILILYDNTTKIKLLKEQTDTFVSAFSDQEKAAKKIFNTLYHEYKGKKAEKVDGKYVLLEHNDFLEGNHFQNLVYYMHDRYKEKSPDFTISLTQEDLQEIKKQEELRQKDIETLLFNIQEKDVNNITNEINKFFGSSIPENHPVILYMQLCNITRPVFRFCLSVLKQEGLINVELKHNMEIPSDILNTLNVIGKELYSSIEELQKAKAELRKTDNEWYEALKEAIKVKNVMFAAIDEVLKGYEEFRDSSCSDFDKLINTRQKFLENLYENGKLKNIEEIDVESLKIPREKLEEILEKVQIYDKLEKQRNEIHSKKNDIETKIKEEEDKLLKTKEGKFISKFESVFAENIVTVYNNTIKDNPQNIKAAKTTFIATFSNQRGILITMSLGKIFDTLHHEYKGKQAEKVDGKYAITGQEEFVYELSTIGNFRRTRGRTFVELVNNFDNKSQAKGLGK